MLAAGRPLPFRWGARGGMHAGMSLPDAHAAPHAHDGHDADSGHPPLSIREALFGAPLAGQPPGQPPVTPGQELGPIVLYAIAVGALALLMPIAVQTLVNTVAFGTLLQPLVVLTLGLLVALGMASVFTALSTYAVEMLERRFFLRWYLEVSGRLSRLAHPVENREELINRFFEIYMAQKSVRSVLVGGLEAALTVSVGLVVLSVYHPLLAAFATLLTAIMVGVLWGGSGTGFRLARLESRAKYDLVSWIEELTIGHRLVAGTRRLVEHADERARDYLHARARRFSAVYRQRIALWSLQAVSTASLLGAGGWLVMQGQLTLGQLVAAELIVSGIGFSIAKLGGVADVVYDLGASATKLDHLAHGLSTAPEVGDGATLSERPWAVSLRAGDEARQVAPGACLAIVGDEGPQESLVEALLLEVSECEAEVRYDGCLLSDVHHDATRKRVVYVGVGNAFSGTLLRNVAATSERVSRARVRETLLRVGLDVDLDLCIDRSGAPLTRSDLVRLAVARAALAEPSVVVVDRALDTLEPDSAMALLASLEGATRLVVTQRADLAARIGNTFSLGHGRPPTDPPTDPPANAGEVRS